MPLTTEGAPLDSWWNLCKVVCLPQKVQVQEEGQGNAGKARSRASIYKDAQAEQVSRRGILG